MTQNTVKGEIVVLSNRDASKFALDDMTTLDLSRITTDPNSPVALADLYVNLFKSKT